MSVALAQPFKATSVRQGAKFHHQVKPVSDDANSCLEHAVCHTMQHIQTEVGSLAVASKVAEDDMAAPANGRVT